MGYATDEDILNAFGPKPYPQVLNTLKKDYTKNKEEALADLYRKDAPHRTDDPGCRGKSLYRLFFDPRRYDLSRAGRFILNRKLGLNVSLDKRVLDAETVIKVIEYLLKLKEGAGSIDDIDHLGNRRVKTVGGAGPEPGAHRADPHGTLYPGSAWQ